MKEKFTLSNGILLTALCISTLAEWFSIVGLTTIFPGATIPIILFGIFLGAGKIGTVVWLRKYGKAAPKLLTIYLLLAASALSTWTSIGILGFLSKAHTEGALQPAAIQADIAQIDLQIAGFDDKIKTSQADLAVITRQVDSFLKTADGATKAADASKIVSKSVQLRASSDKQRREIQAKIDEYQGEIANLRKQRLPLDAQIRKIEAEFGPIKYIAAMIFTDNPSNEVVERTVRYLIIGLVLVFDPLAIALVLAANYSKEFDQIAQVAKVEVQTTPEPVQQVDEQEQVVAAPLKKSAPKMTVKTRSPRIRKVKSAPTEVVKTEQAQRAHTEMPIEVSGMTREIIRSTNGYVMHQGKRTHVRVLREAHPELFMTAEEEKLPHTHYGMEFPAIAASGEYFTRIDMMPPRRFVFLAGAWEFITEVPVSECLQDSEYIAQVANLVAADYVTPEFFGTEVAALLKD